MGELEYNQRFIDVSPDRSFPDYTTQQSDIVLTFRVPKEFDIDDKYDYMFFKFPELYGSLVFRIDNIERNYIYDEFEGTRITFKSVNQDFANTGRATLQNIMPNSPGQGYVEPQIADEGW